MSTETIDIDEAVKHLRDKSSPVSHDECCRIADAFEQMRERMLEAILRERPMTEEEAEAAFDAAPSIPMKPGEIDRIVADVLENDRIAKTLKPCPFCGSRSVDPRGWASRGGKSGPACDECGATTETVELWNKRNE